jgi:hypothetical protein
MVCGSGNGVVRDCGLKSYIEVEAGGMGERVRSKEGGGRSERIF